MSAWRYRAPPENKSLETMVSEVMVIPMKEPMP